MGLADLFLKVASIGHILYIFALQGLTNYPFSDTLIRSLQFMYLMNLEERYTFEGGLPISGFDIQVL